MTFSIATLTIKGVFATFGINPIQHNSTSSANCHYTEYNYAECRNLFIIMLNVVKLIVVLLSVVAPNICLKG